MGLRLTPKPNAFALQLIESQIARLDEAIVDAFSQVGEQFVTDARNMGNYNNVTGNLRSSIGYIVCYNGEVVSENFEMFENGKTGMQTAQKLAEEVAAELNIQGYSLIVVAGMNYAAALESKNYDVLTGASLIAAKDLKERIKLIKKLTGQ